MSRSRRRHVSSALAGGQRVVDLSCGFYHTACVTAEGGVWTWGWGRDGQLGHSEASATPRRVEGTLRQVPCRAVACGHHATSVLSNEGDAYLWGALRDGGQAASSSPGPAASTIQRVSLPANAVAAIAVGGRHALVTLIDGRLCAWGGGQHGQLGLGDLHDREQPEQVATIINVRAASCGESHSAALGLSGLSTAESSKGGGGSAAVTLWVWGRSRYGGGASAAAGGSRSLPRQLSLPSEVGSSVELLTVSCGYHHAACLTTDGRLLCWASAAETASGDDAPPTITVLPPPMGSTYVAVACGGFSTAAIAQAHAAPPPPPSARPGAGGRTRSAATTAATAATAADPTATANSAANRAAYDSSSIHTGRGGLYARNVHAWCVSRWILLLRLPTAKHHASAATIAAAAISLPRPTTATPAVARPAAARDASDSACRSATAASTLRHAASIRSGRDASCAAAASACRATTSAASSTTSTSTTAATSGGPLRLGHRRVRRRSRTHRAAAATTP